MEAIFRDRILACAECGSEFVYTIGQQRMALHETGTTEDPEFCPVCSVKIERMGRRPASDETTSAIAKPLRHTNGYHGRANGSHRPDRAATPVGPLDDFLELDPEMEADLGQSPETNVSPNRPLDYRSGAEHPLYGREGERYTGYVKWFNDRKGFGFIVLDNGVELFVHYSGIAGEGYKSLEQGQKVQLMLEDTEKGPQASQVVGIDEFTDSES